jgi:hypothetical protein
MGPIIYGTLAVYIDVDRRRSPMFNEAERALQFSVAAKEKLGVPLKIG